MLLWLWGVLEGIKLAGAKALLLALAAATDNLKRMIASELSD